MSEVGALVGKHDSAASVPSGSEKRLLVSKYVHLGASRLHRFLFSM